MLEIITGLLALDKNRHGIKQNLVDWASPILRDEKRIHRIMDPRLERNYPSKAAHKAAELILTCLEQEPQNRPCMDEVVSSLQGISAIEMKPSKSKANTTNEPGKCHHQDWHLSTRGQGA